MMLNYLWNFGDQTISNAFSPNHIYQNIGSYFVELVAENNFGCKDSIIKEVLVLPDFDLFIPNAFTPNAKNPIFKPYMIDFDPNNFKFVIYDRWGEVVFETKNPNEWWDGSYDGKNAT
jgi:gliding motility-associated-like protein